MIQKNGHNTAVKRILDRSGKCMNGLLYGDSNFSSFSDTHIYPQSWQ